MSKFIIISGSTRPKSQSAKVAEYVGETLSGLLEGSEVGIVDLAQIELPDWHEGFREEAEPDPVWARISEELRSCDGLVIVSPEWNGMAPPPLMNVFLLTSRGEIAHKPGLLVTVSSGAGGAYPVSQLRSFSTKNTQLCYIPDHVVVRDARNVLNDEKPKSKEDEYLRERIEYSLGLLAVYSKAFEFIRQSGVVDLETFPYGM